MGFWGRRMNTMKVSPCMYGVVLSAFDWKSGREHLPAHPTRSIDGRLWWNSRGFRLKTPKGMSWASLRCIRTESVDESDVGTLAPLRGTSTQVHV